MFGKVSVFICRLTGSTFSMLGKIFCRKHFDILFLFFSQKIIFGISCELSLKETVHMISGKIKKI